MKRKKVLFILFVITFLINFVRGQPSRQRDSGKLSTQYSKKKILCHDNVCVSSGYYK